MHKGYRIISVEAADIYKHEQEYGVAVGYKLKYHLMVFYLFRTIKARLRMK